MRIPTRMMRHLYPWSFSCHLFGVFVLGASSCKVLPSLLVCGFFACCGLSFCLDPGSRCGKSIFLLLVFSLGAWWC